MIFAASFLPIDSLSKLMLILTGISLPLVFLYSLAYIKRHFFRYYFMLALTSIGLIGTIMARDLLSFYIFLEMMTVGIYFLIIDNTKKESYPAGFKYILMMFTGGLFILVAALMLYNLTGTFEFNQIAKVAQALPSQSVQFIFLLFVIGCLFELGSVPFHIWLPDAHPIAPSPISALLSGVVIKVGAYGIIRMLLVLNIVMPSLVFLGAISMLFGIVLALKQTNVKRLLAYSSISQMGYVLLGVGIGSGIGMGGALFHIINHAVFKMLLFLCMGAVIFVTRERNLDKLGGLGKLMPITATTFAIAALAISGIPPFNGYVSKTLLSSAVGNSLWLKSVFLLTAAGTFALMFKLYLHVFSGPLPAKLKNSKEAPVLMTLVMGILATICLLMGLFPNLILAKLIVPVLAAPISIKFISFKIIFETLIVIFLGTSIYIVGSQTGLFKNKAGSLLSIDRLVLVGAASIELFCLKIRKLVARSLNTYLLWVFLTLAALLIYLSI
ncbi:MAG: proton-conducting transporter membrane subunit [bacterium]